MTHAIAHNERTTGLLLPAVLLGGLLALFGAQIGLVPLPAFGDAMLGPTTVTIEPRTYAYRAPGDFLRGPASVDGPSLTIVDPQSLEIMKYQVSAADFALCVADGRCREAEPRRRGEGNVPATGVSFEDATDYARWLSDTSGETWRLPRVAEWVFAAGSKAGDPALITETDSADPAERWLADYEREAARGASVIATPEPLGAFGENEFGVADLAESVWEWTSTCGSRTTLGANGEQISYIEACGVRLLEGRHRTPMSVFIRDARTGGCSVAAPPDNLGFRLVRDRAWWSHVLSDAAQFLHLA